MYQAVHADPRVAAVPAYVRPRAAGVRPLNAVVYPGRQMQFKLVVRFINGQFEELTGPVSGLQWQVLERRGSASDALVEASPGSGLFSANPDPQFLGKTYRVRGIFTAAGATVAGVGNAKIPVPFGRTAGVTRIGR